MSGDRYLLDTNAIVSLLRGNATLLKMLEQADWIGISVISEIEFLAFSALTETDREAFLKFVERVTVIGLNAEPRSLLRSIVKVRKDHRLKLPDAVIAATALWSSADLVTADNEFKRVPKLKVVDWK